MGILKSVPDKNVNYLEKVCTNFSFHAASVCGWQYFMQDFAFYFQYSQNIHIVGILDGQSGPEVSQFCQNQISLILKNCQLMKFQQYQAAIQNMCFSLDQKIKQNKNLINEIRQSYGLPQLPQNQETPSFASLIICIIDQQSVTIGNLGECKCYVSYKYSEEKAVLISGIHMIQKQDDTQKILEKRGFVIDKKINGKYLFTKAIGNLKYKNLENEAKSLISSQPSVFSLRLQDLHCIVLGSSGLWQRPDWVLKQLLKSKEESYQIKQNMTQLIDSLIAMSPQQQMGKQNITAIVLTTN